MHFKTVLTKEPKTYRAVLVGLIGCQKMNTQSLECTTGPCQCMACSFGDSLFSFEVSDALRRRTSLDLKPCFRLSKGFVWVSFLIAYVICLSKAFVCESVTFIQKPKHTWVSKSLSCLFMTCSTNTLSGFLLARH